MKNLNILLMEDEPIAQIIAQHIIAKYNANLDLVINPEDALELLSIKKYDLILLDLRLPGFAPTDFMNKLVNKMNVKTPIIAISAFDSKGKKQECMINGFKEFIEKPLTEEQFKNVINNFCK